MNKPTNEQIRTALGGDIPEPAIERVRALFAGEIELEFELWTEGSQSTGERSLAVFHGKYKGTDFRDAVRNFKRDSDKGRFVNAESLTMWGCRFFTNGVDARKSFG